MKLTRKNRPLIKNPIVLAAIAVVLLLAIFVTLEKTRVIDLVKMPQSQDEKALQEAQQKKIDQDKKQDFIENTPEPIPVPPPSDSDSVTVTASQEGASVTVLTKLKDFAGGSCKLSVANGMREYSATAEVIYQPEFSSCAGFTVPVTELGAGQWAITLTATPTGGSALTKTITLEVK